MTAQIDVLTLQCERGHIDAHGAEQRVRNLWISDPDLRAEFSTVENAIHYFKALANGRVKLLTDQPGLSRSSAT